MGEPRVELGFEAVRDPGDLDRIREVIASRSDAGALVPLEIERLRIAPDAFFDVVSELTRLTAARPGGITMLVDRTVILREGEDLKQLVATAIGSQFDVELVELGTDDHLLADDTAIEAATEAARGSAAVVTVGSGTITDLGKVATARNGGIPLVVVQTAASVDGFTDNVSVVLRSGVKRTIDSRWPNVVLADTTTIAGAPARMNTAGLGELLSLFTAPADWQLAAELGLDSTFAATPRDLLLSFAGDPGTWAGGLDRGDIGAVTRLTETLAIRGIGTGIAGTTACLSGVEHLISHMLDMHAAAHHLEIGLHGEQVGVGSIVAAAAWELLIERMDGSRAELVQVDLHREKRRVESAFATVDPSGRQAAECWADYSTKLAKWGAVRERAQSFVDDWSRTSAPYRELVGSPDRLAAILRAGGGVASAGDLEDWVDDDKWVWAVSNCHLMRNRFTVVDLLAQLGWWEDLDIARVIERARAAAAT